MTTSIVVNLEVRLPETFVKQAPQARERLNGRAYDRLNPLAPNGHRPQQVTKPQCRTFDEMFDAAVRMGIEIG